jgi:2,4-dienoyl-CoA reductase-like NADH-dependent reductase (Old Yellow Enzyme family)
MMNKHTPLFEPINIGNHPIKNRIALAPTHVGSGSERGRVTDQTLCYYFARAKGDVGLVIVEVTGITGRHAFTPGLGLGAASDKSIPGLNDLAQVIHWGGAAAILQLTIGQGAQAFYHHEKRPMVGPSDIPAMIQDEDNLPKTLKQLCQTTPEAPRPMTIAEIQDIKTLTLRASTRGKKAGFEGVEFHGAHGYLLAQFTSPHFNRRGDEYGGSIENRHRLPMEIIGEVKRDLGKDFILGYRLSAREWIDGGADLSDAIKLAKNIQTAGADYISVSQGCYGSLAHIFPRGENTITHDAAMIKKEVAIPVMCANFHNPDTAAAAVADGSVDMIALSRPLLADPSWAKKVKTGKTAGINPCIRCYQCVKSAIITHSPVRCPVNPGLGFERFDPECFPQKRDDKGE